MLDLKAINAGLLPRWSAGAHIELLLPVDNQVLVRHYSLCGEQSVDSSWRIAVLRESLSRGGSRYLCEQVGVGDEILARGPFNRFAFEPARKVHFIAGGIGIAPLLPMTRAAQQLPTCDWHLTYLSRSAAHGCLEAQVAQLPQDRVSRYVSSERGRFDLRAWVDGFSGDEVVYACGPLRLLDDLTQLHVEMRSRRAPARHWQLRLERFENPNDTVGERTSFEVVLARSNRRLQVSPDETILSTLLQAGIDVPCACREGVCGACEQVVLEGIPDHRDAVLSEEERREGTHLMICLSRSLSPSITLDL